MVKEYECLYSNFMFVDVTYYTVAVIWPSKFTITGPDQSEDAT